MRVLSAFLLRGSAAAALVFSASTVSAHIDLLSPAPRYAVNRANGGGGSKECPCGGVAVDPDRVCNVPAAQSHDANRSNNVTTFEAGSTITVRMEEYINHSGRFRVAFDADGADLTDFNSQVLLDVADDQGTQIYELQVTLPNITCENCTLQVIQDMNGNTTTRVSDPAPDSTYYTCADVRLVAAGGGEDAGAAPEETGGTAGTGSAGSAGAASNGTAGAGGSGGTPPRNGSGGGATSPGGGAGGSGAPAGGAASAAAGTAGALAPASDEDDGGGCALEPQRAGNAWAWALAPFGLLVVRSLRRRSAQSGQRKEM